MFNALTYSEGRRGVTSSSKTTESRIVVDFKRQHVTLRRHYTILRFDQDYGALG